MERIRNLREDKDLSQREIAEILSCSQTTYSRYETGNLSIPVDSLIKLAIYFNTSIDYLTGLTDEKKPYKCSSKTIKI
ncbi:MAG: helix-turn-helix domain-containing protein [Erysipelotrichaceae bacterium]|nr:helix-turn-helix domain-containing protein [Erysipelotrichaceae bacterium]